MHRSCAWILTALVSAGCLAAAAPIPSVAANWMSPDGSRSASANGYMVATAHPLATKAGCRILMSGGTAMDAAVAVQAVLSVVEPHASGLAGGTILTYWDNKAKRIRFFDGLARAPKAVQADLRTPTVQDKRRCKLTRKGHLRSTVNFTGRAVGVPGTVAVLALAHRELGTKPWKALFDEAIAAARDGFPMPRYLHAVLDGKAKPPGAKKGLRRCQYPDLRRLYCINARTPRPLTSTVRNPELAKVLQELRDGGAAAFYASEGKIASAIVARVGQGRCKTSIKDGRPATVPGRLTTADFAAYKAIERKPICKSVIGHIVCSAPPPSYGGMAVLTMLHLLEAKGIAKLKPGSIAHAHLRLEASRLVQADRRQFIGDPDFSRIRLAELLAPGYLDARTLKLSMHKALRHPAIGQPKASGPIVQVGRLDEVAPQDQTSHVSIVDRHGNAVSMTTTVNTNFGSQLQARGMALNNVLVNFTRKRSVSPGWQVNRMQTGKRPRTAMSPTLVFTKSGKLRLVVGAAGGGAIPDYVTKVIVGILIHGMSPSAALRSPNVSGQSITKTRCRGGRGFYSDVEKGTAVAAYLNRLKRLGHPCPRQRKLRSGLTAIAISPAGILTGAADHRRDGNAWAVTRAVQRVGDSQISRFLIQDACWEGGQHA